MVADGTMKIGRNLHRVSEHSSSLRLPLGPFRSWYRYLYDDVRSEPEPMPWLDETWAPGETLSFVLIEDPEWTDGFSDLAAAETFIEEEVMDVWSDISSADIVWDIGSRVAARTPRMKDGFNSLWQNPRGVRRAMHPV